MPQVLDHDLLFLLPGGGADHVFAAAAAVVAAFAAVAVAASCAEPLHLSVEGDSVWHLLAG